MTKVTVSYSLIETKPIFSILRQLLLWNCHLHDSNMIMFLKIKVDKNKSSIFKVRGFRSK